MKTGTLALAALLLLPAFLVYAQQNDSTIEKQARKGLNEIPLPLLILMNDCSEKIDDMSGRVIRLSAHDHLIKMNLKMGLPATTGLPPDMASQLVKAINSLEAVDASMKGVEQVWKITPMSGDAEKVFALWQIAMALKLQRLHQAIGLEPKPPEPRRAPAAKKSPPQVEKLKVQQH